LLDFALSSSCKPRLALSAQDGAYLAARWEGEDLIARKIMPKKQKARPGVRHYLRDHGLSYLQYLQDGDFINENLARLAEGLTTLLKSELRSHEECELFWMGIKPALAGCPKDEHFSTYENILAYGFVHVLDRYLRAWETMKAMVEHCVLPAPQSGLSILDIGSGPAPVLHAAGDFYRHLNDFATAHRIGRLAIPQPDLQPVEVSRGMCHFFHLLSEYTGRQGPFGPLLSDFGGFDPQELRESARLQEENEFYDEGSWNFFTGTGEIRTWAHDLYRYQLVFFGNGAKVAMNYPVAEAPSTVELTV
jgi:hypothetical protein